MTAEKEEPIERDLWEMKMKEAQKHMYFGRPPMTDDELKLEKKQ